MKFLIVVILLISNGAAFAQQQPTKFTPYMINQESHKQIMDYLMDQPAKFSLPLINALGNLAQKANEEEKKKEEPAK